MGTSLFSSLDGHLAVKEHVKDCIATSVRCLEAVLQIPRMAPQDIVNNMIMTEILSPRDEVKTRCKLVEILLNFTGNVQEAEIHLQKAISDVDPLKYTVWSLQVMILKRAKNLGAAKYVIGQALADAALQGIPQWYYYFIGQRINIHIEEEDTVAAMTVIAAAVKEAGNRKDSVMMVSFLLRKATLCLHHSDIKETTATLKTITTILPPLPSKKKDQNNPPIPADKSLQPLRFVYYLIDILCKISNGEVSDARGSLLKMQEIMDSSKSVLSSTKVLPFDGMGFVNIQASNSIGNLSVMVQLQSLEIPRLFVIAFLVAAMVWKPVDPKTSYDYVKQGMKTFHSSIVKLAACHGPLSDALQNRHDFVEIQLLFCLVLGELKVMKGEYVDAMNAFLLATQCMQYSPSLEKNYRKVIMMDMGMLYQATGYFGHAYKFLTAAEEEMMPNEILRGFAVMTVKIMLTAAPIVEIPVNIVENYLSSHQDSQTTVRFLLEVFGGVQAASAGEVQRTKSHFLEVLKTSDKNNSQYKGLALLVLGSLFIQTSPEQAKKMLELARESGEKYNMWLVKACAVAGLKHLAVVLGDCDEDIGCIENYDVITNSENAMYREAVASFKKHFAPQTAAAAAAVPMQIN
ncbi:hypothetical protein HDU97_004015 [Phlyctochytrium planicorne]|nr:hypothetical protein HDU97_004015 [Phlyctochytrium planicorne]